MSDFLTNLAARALGAPALRPRTRSRFEPEPEASPWIVDAIAPVAETRAPRSEPASRRVVESASERAEQEPLSTTRPLDDSIAPPPRRREPRFEAPIRSADAEPPLSKAEASPRHSETTHHTTERIVEREVEHHHDHTTIRVEHETTRRQIVESPQHRDEEPSTPRRPDDSPAPPPPPRHRYDEQLPRIERVHRETLVEPQPAPPQRPRIETPAAPEPAIHVSIGRVEVRAAAPAPAPQRTRARNAPMTLEDYAAKRNAKGRP